MQPESSDGFASVGTILPKEKAALLPGGFFVARRLIPNSNSRQHYINNLHRIYHNSGPARFDFKISARNR
jgi:hypothetical protein